MTWLYHEGDVREACAAIRACYHDAAREPDDLYPVWVARIVYDAAHGMTWAASVRKHTRACREALGLEGVPGSFPVRSGRVRLDGRAMTDDGGPWLALGASYFPLLWLVRRDRDRLISNLTWLKARGVDFIRSFGDVSGVTWSDRAADMDAATYESDLHYALGLARDLGLRVAWTLFAGPAMAHDAGWYRRKALAFAEALAGRLDTVQYIEVRNETEGPDDATTRVCAEALSTALPGVPVALCGTPEGGLPAIYAGSSATLATVHYDRAYHERGWRPVRQPWGYYDLDGMPTAHVNNEPIGVDSSVSEHVENGVVVQGEHDPVKMACAGVTSWISGEAAYVLHHGAGIRAGGVADVEKGRRADCWDQNSLESALALLAGARVVLPANLCHWERQGHAWASHPLTFSCAIGDDVESGAGGANRAYAATQGDRAVCLVAGIRGRFRARSKAGPLAVWIPRRDGAWEQMGPSAEIDLHESQAAAALLIR